MKKFLNDYCNIRRMISSKKTYARQIERVRVLPEDYQYVFKQIQTHMWQLASGAGYDVMEVELELIELFEGGAADGKTVLEVTGEDVAGFVEELVKNVRTHTEDWKDRLNRTISKKLERCEGQAVRRA